MPDIEKCCAGSSREIKNEDEIKNKGTVNSDCFCLLKLVVYE